MRLPTLSRLWLVIAAIILAAAAFFFTQYNSVAKAPLLTDPALTQPAPKLAENFFHEQVEPVINSRCVVCHACYDAPCQLKMTAPEGIARGANKNKVYEGARLTADTPNRLFIDAQTVEQWRQRDFYPVVSEAPNDGKTHAQASVLAQMLLLKQQNPLPPSDHLDESFDISLNRSQQCPTEDEMGNYIAATPLGGMPYALPGLSPQEHDTLISWLAAGAPLPTPAALPKEEADAKAELEAFLNQDSLKAQLMARYIYEHLFTSHLYFESLVEDGVQPQFYNLVRSRTSPDKPLDIVATRRPFDDPHSERVWYRLQPVTATIVSKTHQPYAINDDLVDKWQRWFLDADYNVSALPSYKPAVAANPLIAFTELPVNARYRFMLERAENTIMGYIKGPVCRGQVALNVINDRFWVYFVDPDIATSPALNAFYDEQKENLRMPAEKDSTALAVNWVKYAKHQGDYMRARTAFMQKTFTQGEHLTLDSIWQGDGWNTNASLTVFRHFDNATVVKGLVGKPPKTAWVIDYALLERIHYLLVAGFDVYGNYGHQLMTRLYMDFLRMEGESNFLVLLPPESRKAQLHDWYQKAGPELTDFIEGNVTPFDQPTGIAYSTDNPKQELFGLLADKLADVQPSQFTVGESSLARESTENLMQLADIKGTAASIFPEISMIAVNKQDGEKALFTLIRNSAHYNVNSLFDEDDNRHPEEDSLTLVNGLLGSYPDVFWQVNEQDIVQLVAQAKQVGNQEDYRALLDKYGMRRTNPEFWAFSDAVIRQVLAENPIEAGWLDYNRLEDR